MNWFDKRLGSNDEKCQKQMQAKMALQSENRPASAANIEARIAEDDKKAKDAQALTVSDIRKAVSLKPDLYSMPRLSPFTWENPQPRKPLEPELTVVEPVIGWRRWSVEMFGNELRSNNGVRWTPYEKLTAECKARPSLLDPAAECEGVHCTCGIYAYKTPEDAKFGENAPRNLGTGSRVDVWGQVMLWGRVVEHSKGWRAQYAYPKSFVDSGIARQVATVYGCKVIQDQWPGKSIEAFDAMLRAGNPQAIQMFQWTPGGIVPYGSII